MNLQLSLSVRIVEAACKTKLNIAFEELVNIATDTGYDAVCMRASAGGVQTPLEELRRMRGVVEAKGLHVSMVTADFDVPLNNGNGPNSLRDIDPSLDVAEALGCNLIRVCLKKDEDISHAREAAKRAADRGIRLAHQCHTTSIFEQVKQILTNLEAIGQPNFGLIYEPANLMLCGEKYGPPTLARLAPHIMNVYIQNHRLDPEGSVTLPTHCRGNIHFHQLPIWEAGGVDTATVFEGLKEIDWASHFTIHQAEGIKTISDARLYASRCAEFVRENEV
ncbi:MAG: TIM barrel protein [Verrucomicrobiota bacterium]|jgi:sugar phosphate isomerase/epimerase|nr:TIM barrel protein [Verrucomicrobiota bacterium]